jgi:hypothetical protein
MMGDEFGDVLIEMIIGEDPNYYDIQDCLLTNDPHQLIMSSDPNPPSSSELNRIEFYQSHVSVHLV